MGEAVARSEAATLDPDSPIRWTLATRMARWTSSFTNEAPKEPVVVTAPIPEPVLVTPTAPPIEPAAIPPPAPSARPPVYNRGDESAEVSLFTLVIVIGLPFSWFWGCSGGAFDSTTTTSRPNDCDDSHRGERHNVVLPAADIKRREMRRRRTIDGLSPIVGGHSGHSNHLVAPGRSLREHFLGASGGLAGMNRPSTSASTVYDPLVFQPWISSPTNYGRVSPFTCVRPESARA